MSIEIDNNPYLIEPGRLSDVIAAIQALSTYKFYKLDVKGWSKRISGTEENSEHWKKVFNQHPEFFRLTEDGEKVSLVWRRNKHRRFSVDLNMELSLKELEALPNLDRKNRISRVPLTYSEVETLITVAKALHSKAIDDKKDKRWWIIPLLTVLGGLLGAYIGAHFGK